MRPAKHAIPSGKLHTATAENALEWLSALLAQLVEHLHGKEGVSDSIPEEGFCKSAANGALTVPQAFQRASLPEVFGKPVPTVASMGENPTSFLRGRGSAYAACFGGTTDACVPDRAAQGRDVLTTSTARVGR